VSLQFLFVQFEFTHAIGPHAGRYVVEPKVLGGHASPAPSADPGLDMRNRELAGVTRGVGSSDVLAIGVVGAPAGKPRLLRRTRAAQDGAPPADVPLSLVTFIKGTEPIGTQHEAAAHLDLLRASDSEQQRLVNAGLKALNLAIRGYRAGAPDPYASEVTLRDARRVRIGFGSTEEVQDGRWVQAVELPPPAGGRTSRIERLRPSEAVASVLAGNSEVLESEELLLRALIDLDQDRTRAAAYQAAAAVSLLRRELRSRSGLDDRELATLAASADVLVRAAADGPLSDDQVRELEAVVDAVAGLLDRWRYRQQAG
jgi:hypothetical protein